MSSRTTSQQPTPVEGPSPAARTRQQLLEREEEIDSRVAALKSRLTRPRDHGSRQSAYTNHSEESDSSVAHSSLTPPPRNSRRGFGVPAAFKEAETPERKSSSHERRSNYQSAFSTPAKSSPYMLPQTGKNVTSSASKRRLSTGSVAGAAPKKKKQGWFEWMRMGCPSRRHAGDAAAVANQQFERQRLYAEEGRSGYGGIERQSSYGGRHSFVDTQSIATPRRSARGNNLTPVTPRSSPPRR